MKTRGWLFDINKCTGCHACEVACATWNRTGAISWRTIVKIESGTYPQVSVRNLSMPCLHCDQAPCLHACPVRAISKGPDGIVTVDQATCIGCMFCFWACPFGVPKLGVDGKMSKCTYCGDRPPQLPRACEEVCPTKAILSGDVEDLEQIAAQAGGERVGGPAAPALFVIR
ncbi:MAG TPA: 4Fe-4S dicluster domain-containing protein [Candidatus Methylomirabilis sp.]|nr:4Fe-4S dicluster domain-containing protein [Candidatus Methylomirabilis sp.]